MKRLETSVKMIGVLCALFRGNTHHPQLTEQLSHFPLGSSYKPCISISRSHWTREVNQEDTLWLLVNVVLGLSAKWKVHCHLPWENFFEDSGLVGCPLLFSFSAFARAHFEGTQLKFTCIGIISDNAQDQRKSSGVQDTWQSLNI